MGLKATVTFQTQSYSHTCKQNPNTILSPVSGLVVVSCEHTQYDVKPVNSFEGLGLHAERYKAGSLGYTWDRAEVRGLLVSASCRPATELSFKFPTILNITRKTIQK